MKRQPRILAGGALGLLMASAPLGAYPLQGIDIRQALAGSGSQPVVRIQADCPEGASAQDCAQGQGKKQRQKERRGEEGAAPAENQPRQKRQAEPVPAEQAPAPKAEPEQARPRKERQKPTEPAPAEQAPAQQEKTAPPAAGEAPAPERKPRRERQKQEQAAPAPAAQPPAGAGQQSGQAGEKSKNDKLRDYLKKKQNGEAAPAENQPAGQQPAAKPEPKRESGQKPAGTAQPPAQGEQPPTGAAQPSGQAGEKSKNDKLRDYLKKKQNGEAAPAENQPAGQQPTAKPGQESGQKPAGQPAPQAEKPAPNGERPAGGRKAGERAGGPAEQATQPQLPADTRAQPMPKGEAEARPPLENAAPLPDSAKGAGRTRPRGEQAGGANGRRPEQPPAGQAQGKPEAVPDSDSAAQTDIGKIGRIESVEAMQGKRVDRNQWQQDWRKRRGEAQRGGNEGQVVKEVDNRVIIREGDTVYVDNRDASARLERHARDSYIEELPDDFSRDTIVKDDGTRIVTIRNSYGDIVRRSRIAPDNREVVLYYVPESDYGRLRDGYYDAGADLPPLQLDIPADQYILDAQYAQPDDYYAYLDAPPVEPVERIYSIDEVVHSARIRDKVRRVDLDTITFDTGSAEIGEDQVNHLQALGDAINRILKQNPAETFLIEGHTDAVGSEESNLVLSDERAQSVAEALTSVFDIPAENLTTQGYGEEYLKVNVQGDNRENRRVAVRRITPLVAPVASNQ